VPSKSWAPYSGGGLGVDVDFATGYDTVRFLKKALLRKVQVKFQGKRYSAATREDLVVLKIHAYRVRDLDDMATVLERRFSELDWDPVHRWTTELKCDKLLKEIVEQFMENHHLKGPLPWKRVRK
jgi:predicted nucleotidyltransferase